MANWPSNNGLPSDGVVGQVVVNTAPGVGEWGDSPAPTTTNVGALINSATAKNTPVDADMLGLMDSASTPVNLLKKLSWAYVKSVLKTYFDGIYLALAGDSSLLTLNPAPANLAWSGPTHPGTAGETLTIGSCCFQGPDVSGKWWKVKGTIPPIWVADTVYAVGQVVRRVSGVQDFYWFCSAIAGDAKSHATTEPVYGVTLGGTTADDMVTWTCISTQSYLCRRMATGTINAGATGVFLKHGYLRNDGWSALIVGQPCFLDPSTAGLFTQTVPSASGNLIQIIARAATQAKTIDFNPDWTNLQVA
jgi:hypothetical protein